MSERRAEIVDLGLAYSARRRELAALAMEIRAEQRKVLLDRWEELQNKRTEAQTARDMLCDAAEENADLFEKPKTWTIDDIRIGYRKKLGRLEWADETAVVVKLRQLHPDREDLVRVKMSPNRAALKNLTVRELAALGVTVVEDQDVLVVETAKDDLERVMQALMAEGPEDVASE